MFCPNCGAKVNEGLNFCSNCGSKIAAETQMNQPVASESDKATAATPKKKGGAAKIIIPIVVGVLALGLVAVIGIIAVVCFVLGSGDDGDNVTDTNTEQYSEVIVEPTEAETEPASKYSTADAEKFYLDLIAENNGLECYYIASTNESNIGDIRLELVGIDCVQTYVADGNDYSNVVIDGVRVFDTLTSEEYRTLLFNGANSGYSYFVFAVDDINAYFDSIWEPGRFTAQDFADNCQFDAYLSESGYLFYGMGAQGFGNDYYKTKILSSEAVGGGFVLKVKLVDAFVDMGETDAMLYDYYAGNYVGIYPAGNVDISTVDFDEVLSGASLTDDDVATLTVTIIETDEGLRLESIK